MTWTQGANMVSQAQFFAYLIQTAESYAAVESYPHEPKLLRHFYLHPEPIGGDGNALRELLRRFRPASPIDHDLILAFFLSLFWGGGAWPTSGLAVHK